MSRALGKLYFRKRDIDNDPMKESQTRFRKMGMKESTIRKQILDYLNSLPESHFVINRPGAESGEADITGCIKGRRCEFEVKLPGQWARKLQVHKLKLWANAGAIVSVLYSVDGAKEILEEEGFL